MDERTITKEVLDVLVHQSRQMDRLAVMVKDGTIKPGIAMRILDKFPTPEDNVPVYGLETSGTLLKAYEAELEHYKTARTSLNDVISEKMALRPDSERPQQGTLEYYCQKAIEKGYLEKTETGYKRVNLSKAQLAYFLDHFRNHDGTFPDKKYSILFNESRLGKASSQLADNKNGDGKPMGYEVIDELFTE